MITPPQEGRYAQRSLDEIVVGWGRYAVPRPWKGVPTISRFHGITISMYFDDHPYPHFHAETAGRKAKVRIDQIEVIKSNLTRTQLRMVCEWAAVHQSELEMNWRRARDHGTLVPIEPWK